MEIVVGSENPVKVNACRQAFRRAFPQASIVVSGVSVESGVSAQPADEELYEGSKNRAVGAMSLKRYDYAVGIEGGTLRVMGDVLVTAAIYIIDSRDRVGYGISGGFLVPPSISSKLGKMELGDAVDAFTNEHDTKRKGGAVGLVTRGLIDRSALYEHGVLLALARFISDDIWK